MTASLAQPLAQAPRVPALAVEADAVLTVAQAASSVLSELRAAQQGDGGQGQGGVRYGVGYGVADREGGVKTQAGGQDFRQGPSAASALENDPTQTAYTPTPHFQPTQIAGSQPAPFLPTQSVGTSSHLLATPTEQAHPTLRYPLPLVSPLNAHETHFVRARRVKRERYVTAWALVANRTPRDLAPCTVVLTRLAKRRLDSDNLQGAFKAVRDEIAAHLGVDDGDESQVNWRYLQGYAPKPTVEIAFHPYEVQR
jgi:hypothetical protein